MRTHLHDLPVIDPLTSFAALKQTDLATKLFEAVNGDADADVSTADAGFLLGLLTAGTLRDRVDAACDAPGAPGAGSHLSRSAALMQLQLCARVRKLAAPKTTALLHSTRIPCKCQRPRPSIVPSRTTLKGARNSLPRTFATGRQVRADMDRFVCAENSFFSFFFFLSAPSPLPYPSRHTKVHHGPRLGFVQGAGRGASRRPGASMDGWARVHRAPPV